jgi:hypothetical protein
VCGLKSAVGLPLGQRDSYDGAWLMHDSGSWHSLAGCCCGPLYVRAGKRHWRSLMRRLHGQGVGV